MVNGVALSGQHDDSALCILLSVVVKTDTVILECGEQKFEIPGP